MFLPEHGKRPAEHPYYQSPLSAMSTMYLHSTQWSSRFPPTLLNFLLDKIASKIGGACIIIHSYKQLTRSGLRQSPLQKIAQFCLVGFPCAVHTAGIKKCASLFAPTPTPLQMQRCAFKSFERGACCPSTSCLLG